MRNATTVELAQPVWHFSRPQLVTPGGEQRPDIVLDWGEALAVLDAKYYFPLPEDRCGWGDLVKQHFYAASMGGARPTKNGLIFPDPTVTVVEKVGVVRMEGPPGTAEIFSPITVMVANPSLVLECYVDGRYEPDFERQVRAALFS
jgi:hypothetical protein